MGLGNPPSGTQNSVWNPGVAFPSSQGHPARRSELGIITCPLHALLRNRSVESNSSCVVATKNWFCFQVGKQSFHTTWRALEIPPSFTHAITPVLNCFIGAPHASAIPRESQKQPCSKEGGRERSLAWEQSRPKAESRHHKRFLGLPSPGHPPTSSSTAKPADSKTTLGLGFIWKPRQVAKEPFLLPTSA